MTTRTVQLGDPSQAEKGANQQVADVFAEATYPLQVFVKNHMPREVVFPEVPGLHLRHVSHAADSKKSVTIASYDLFQRLASSIAQIAELNRYKLAITIRTPILWMAAMMLAQTPTLMPMAAVAPVVPTRQSRPMPAPIPR